MKDELQIIINGAEIPSVPLVLQKIIALSRDPSASSRQIEELVRKEPGLVTHILKTVNSAYYGSRREISSLNHAVVLLGFSLVKSIACGLMLIDTFNSLPGLNKNYVLSVWKHSLFCAGLMRVIAKEVSQNLHEEMFLASLVHNIGHLVLSQYFGHKYDELIKANIFPSVEEEGRYLKVNHAEIGSVLLGKWKFSDEIINIVNAHHQAELFEGEKKKIWYLKLCDLVARNDADIEEYLNQEESELSPEVKEILENADWKWSTLKENRDIFNQILESVNQAIPQNLR